MSEIRKSGRSELSILEAYLDRVGRIRSGDRARRVFRNFERNGRGRNSRRCSRRGGSRCSCWRRCRDSGFGRRRSIVDVGRRGVGFLGGGQMRHRRRELFDFFLQRLKAKEGTKGENRSFQRRILSKCIWDSICMVQVLERGR